MHQRLVIAAAVIVISFLGISKNSSASALGLADGTYTIEIDFFGVFSDLNGTITIGPAPSFVTSFDVGDLECTVCTVGSSVPDLVEVNDGSTFKIIDSSSAFLVTLSSGGSAFGTFNCPAGISCNYSAGVWTAQSVPEPLSSTLLLFGLGALGMWPTLNRKTR